MKVKLIEIDTREGFVKKEEELNKELDKINNIEKVDTIIENGKLKTIIYYNETKKFKE